MQMADGRVVKLRHSCLKGYAAGMGRRSEGMGHSNRHLERSKRRRTPAFAEHPSWAAVGRAWLDPSGTSRAQGKDPQVSKPESTEGGPWGQPLKKPAGAPLNLG